MEKKREKSDKKEGRIDQSIYMTTCNVLWMMDMFVQWKAKWRMTPLDLFFEGYVSTIKYQLYIFGGALCGSMALSTTVKIVCVD